MIARTFIFFSLLSLFACKNIIGTDRVNSRTVIEGVGGDGNIEPACLALKAGESFVANPAEDSPFSAVAKVDVKTAGKERRCTVALIDSNIALGSAACLSDSGTAFPSDDYEVSIDGQSSQSVSKVILHAESPKFDVALLILAGHFQEHLYYYGLRLSEPALGANTEFTTAGYGAYTDGNDQASYVDDGKLRNGKLKFLAKVNSTFSGDSQEYWQLGATDAGEGLCKGDEGAPLLYANGNKVTVAGIAAELSNTDSSSAAAACHTAGPTLFTPIDRVAPWIKAKLAEENLSLRFSSDAQVFAKVKEIKQEEGFATLSLESVDVLNANFSIDPAAFSIDVCGDKCSPTAFTAFTAVGSEVFAEVNKEGERNAARLVAHKESPRRYETKIIGALVEEAKDSNQFGRTEKIAVLKDVGQFEEKNGVAIVNNTSTLNICSAGCSEANLYKEKFEWKKDQVLIVTGEFIRGQGFFVRKVEEFKPGEGLPPPGNCPEPLPSGQPQPSTQP